MTAEPLPAWAFPPSGGFTADDLDRMPDLPPHTELIDGSLVFVSPQRHFHSLAMYLLETGLRASVPESLRVCREMTITINKGNRPEPDISILRAEAVSDEADETGYDAADAVLAVEVVSPESEGRDRERKPQLYAKAGIPHFWRIEKGEGRRPVVYVYELDPATGAYVPTGIHHDRLKLTVPFDIDIDLTEIDRL
ncbi:Uma2 family endonuclease [Streptomyces sp. NBRC 110028]|uniref:Uma2 family endonuclease n=1 Tax=Streptomyces sp. NBRC 110028 TaxID=1621260 RepID=UPI0006E2010B|nr:Uma2 family endonuclease [Streptomyces sp. NBRC 110028]